MLWHCWLDDKYVGHWHFWLGNRHVGNFVSTEPMSHIYRSALTLKGKGSPYSITVRRVHTHCIVYQRIRDFRDNSAIQIDIYHTILELIPVLGSHPAGEMNHKPDGRLSLLSARPAVTPATLTRAATSFAAWWTEAQWVWTVCLRLLPDSIATVIWT